MKSTILATLSLFLFVAPCVQSQTVPATDVADALDSFKLQAVTKIDQDLEANARAFADAKNINRGAFWSDLFSPFLDIARAVYDSLTAIPTKSPNSVRSTVKTLLQSADSAQKVYTLAHTGFDRFWQDGQNLQLAIDGPAYTASVNAMLDRADDTWFLLFDYDSYRLSILNDLNGISGSSPLRVARKAATVDRTGGEVLPTLYAAKTYIYDQLRTLSTEMRQRQLPPARITEIAAFIDARRRDLLNSRVGNSPIAYSAYLLKGSTPVLCPVSTSLGTVTALERWRITMLGAYADNLDVELRVRVAETADTGLSLAADTLTEMVSFNLSYEATIAGQAQANEILKNATTLGFSIAKPEVGSLFNTARTSASNAREQINMIPQQMMDALPGEVSKVLLLVDDTIQYVRTLTNVSPSVSLAVASITPPVLTGLPLPQTQLLRIIGSGFTANSTLLFNGSIASDPARLYFISANEIDYYVRTDTTAADWNVKVIDGAQQSNLGYFRVIAPTPNTGSLTVNLSPSGAVSAGAQWRVDSGSYRNNGDTATGLTPGSHAVSFKSVSGYTTPADKSVSITSGANKIDSGSYTVITPNTYTLTLNYNPAQGGASPSPLVSQTSSTYGSYSFGYTSGSVTLVQASASAGYHFTGWSGDASGTANPTTVTMNGNKSVTANFASGDPNLGTMILTIVPPEAAAAGVQWGWNADDYRNSGTSVNSFPGTYIFTIHPVDGWLGPIQKVVTIIAGQTTNATVTFTRDTTPGMLTVTISPPDAVTAGARWHVNGGPAQGNGATVSLPPASGYSVTFDSVSGWTAPLSQTVAIQHAQTTVAIGNYMPPAGQPVIAAIHPSFGGLAGGTALTIEGINFLAPATVLIGGKPATNVSVLSPSQILCFTPSNSVFGTVPIVVQTPGGSATNLNGFSYGAERGNGIELVTSFGGGAYAVAVQGNYAYVGEGSSLIVVNISNPTTPSRVGRLSMPGKVMDLALLGQYAYVANADAGLQVVDISNPSAPTLRGFYSATPCWAAGIAILGGRAYVADVTVGLQIFDLGTPTVPVLLSATNLGGTAADVAVKATANGVFAYLCVSETLAIWDVSDPVSPTLRSQLPLGGYASSLAVVGTRAFAGGYEIGLKMVDIANADVPVYLGRDPNATHPMTVVAANSLVYVLDALRALAIFDYSGGTLTRVGWMANTTGSDDLAVVGNRAYVAGTTGFGIIDVSNPANPSVLSAFSDTEMYGSYASAALSGNYLFTGGSSAFKAFDVSNPGQPNQIGQNANVPDASQILLNRGFAYVVNGGYGIQILNVTTPASPSVVGSSTHVPGIYPSKVALSGNTLVVVGGNTSGQARFLIADVTDPSAPVIHGIIDFPEFYIVGAVAAVGNKAVIVTSDAQGGGSLKVLNIANIDAPVQQGEVTNIGASHDMQMSSDGHYAYVLDLNAGLLRVVDVGNASHPVVVSSVSVAGRPWGINVQNSVVYVASTGTWSGISGFDVSDPASPRLGRSYTTASGAYGIAYASNLGLQKDIMFVPNSDGGVAVLRVKDLQPPEIYITDPTFSSTYTITASSCNLGGGASDNQGVTRVVWSNSRGGGGDADGTESWFVSGVPLQPGTNILTVTGFDQAGNSGSDTLTVIYQTPKQDQTITFPAVANRTFGDAPILLAAAASGGLPVTFSVVSGPASLSSNLLTLTGAGSVTVRATQPGNAQFNAAPPVNVDFTVAKAEQSVTFAVLADKAAGGPPFALSATASSGLPVAFGVVSGLAVLDTNLVTLLGGGMVTLSAGQPGNSNYNAAVTVQRSFNVGKIPQTISFGPLSRQTLGDALFPLAASANSGLPVNFSLLSGPAILNSNVVAVTNAGLVVVRASQPGDSVYAPAAPVDRSLVVAAGNNIITDHRRLPNGQFTLVFAGDFERPYVVECSTNLTSTNWLPLITNSVDSLGNLEFTDSSATNRAGGFYRVKGQ